MSKGGGFRGLMWAKGLSTSCSACRSHYDVLGVTPKATQADIKAAYYKLSMVYHPDKNQSRDDAASAFRDISAAYEVLGSHATRRLYDRGLLHSRLAADDAVDDQQTKFYKAREQRTRPPHPSGQAPIYNFDEWNRQHYTAVFNRRSAAAGRHSTKDSNKVISSRDRETDIVLGLSAFMFVMLLYTCGMATDYDVIEFSDDQER